MQPQTPDVVEMNPIDYIEQFVAARQWAAERNGDDELAFEIKGALTDYQLGFSWMTDIEVLYLICCFDLPVPPHRVAEVERLVVAISEKLWVGHFAYHAANRTVAFCHGTPMAGTSSSESHLETLISCAANSCEQYYPAFQAVVWAGLPVKEALAMTSFQTEGTA